MRVGWESAFRGKGAVSALLSHSDERQRYGLCTHVDLTAQRGPVGLFHTVSRDTRLRRLLAERRQLRDVREYGDVECADPINHKYPIDNAEHVRAAWRYIQQEDNASKYDSDEVDTIKQRIKKAATKHGVEISGD